MELLHLRITEQVCLYKVVDGCIVNLFDICYRHSTDCNFLFLVTPATTKL